MCKCELQTLLISPKHINYSSNLKLPRLDLSQLARICFQLGEREREWERERKSERERGGERKERERWKKNNQWKNKKDLYQQLRDLISSRCWKVAKTMKRKNRSRCCFYPGEKKNNNRKPARGCVIKWHKVPGTKFKSSITKFLQLRGARLVVELPSSLHNKVGHLQNIKNTEEVRLYLNLRSIQCIKNKHLF